MGRLSSTVVAITGASAGIGRATAVLAAAEGAAVVVSARRTDRLEVLARDIRSAGGRVLPVTADVTDEAAMQQLVASAVDTFGTLDVMVCNAGIGFHGPLDETPLDAIRRLIEVNVLGTIFAARAALPVMRRQGRGHVIAVSSIAGRRGVGGSSVYSATKAAEIGLIEALRAEFAGTPLNASVVYPVATRTEFHDAMARDFHHRVSGRGPRQPPERVARAIVDCIVHPRAEVFPYRPARLLSVLNTLAPATTDRFVKRFGRRPRPATPDDGHHT